MRIRFGTGLVTVMCFICSSGSRLCAAEGRGRAVRLGAAIARISRKSVGLCGLVYADTEAAGIAAGLAGGNRLFVHVLVADSALRDKARRQLTARGLAKRTSVAVIEADSAFPYADNLLNLLVVGGGTGGPALPPLSECRRVLAPGGTLCTRPRAGARTDVEARLRQAGFVNVTVQNEDGEILVFARSPVPDGMDDWPQFMHGADNNAVSQDRFVGPPNSLRWTVGPRWSRDHDVTPSIFGLVSTQGRIFYIEDGGPTCVIDPRLPEKWSLVARDAFNGTLLWKRSVKDWYSSRQIWGHIPASAERRMVATAERVLVTPGLQAPVIALNAADGRMLHEYKGTERTSEIVLDGDTLLLVIRRTDPLEGKTASRNRRRFRPGFRGLPDGGEALMAVRLEDGAILWRKERHCRPLTLAVQAGRVFFGEGENTVCVDRVSGRELWCSPGRADTVVVRDGVVLVGARIGQSRRTELRALSARDGRRLWSRQGNYLPTFMFFQVPVDVFVASGLVWGLAQDLEWNKSPGSGILPGLDLWTGEEKARRDMTGAFTAGHHVRCYKSKATDRYLLFNKRGIEFVETRSGRGAIQVRWVRGACRYGIMPANGLIYAPPQACFCYPETKPVGFNAVAARRLPESGTQEGAASRLEPGPARERSIEPSPASPEDWPTYRHDPRRTGTCPTDVPAKPVMLWSADLGERITPPIAVNGRVFVAGKDTCTLNALDAVDGRRLWKFVAGGVIDSAPTVVKGRVLFGASDGAVYCLDAADGTPVWTFRAAPTRRLVAEEGRLASAWPVHGSVLVFRDVVYTAAGRSSVMDGGIDVYGLNPLTGSVVHHTRLSGPGETAIHRAGAKIDHVRRPGALSDLLLTDGRYIYMRHVKLDPELPEKTPVRAMTWGAKGPRHFLATSGFLDDTLFNRSVWQYGAYVHRSQMLTFDDRAVYGLRVYSGISWNAPIWNVGDGYLLFCRPYRPPAKKRKAPAGQERLLFRVPYGNWAWWKRVHVLVRAMVTAGVRPKNSRVFIAGAPEQIRREDPLAAFEGRTGGRLLTFAAGDGTLLGRIKLPGPPVFDGMIAARGRLYLSLRNGRLVCLGRPKQRQPE
ncbi:MAG: PQQ-binding-like beta-propeller repeat protein [Kiritimatiellaeota bacterium]|nr:PQQ-binding-like beta-propeller repeat protein [Kiritimatiellota bacterium]